MANLESTATDAFDYMLNLINDAAALGDVTVLDSEPVNYVPNTYIILNEVGNHHLTIESLPYYAFQETYQLIGMVRAWRADQNWTQARNDAKDAFNHFVMTPVIEDGKRLGNILQWIVPSSMNRASEISDNGGAVHTITFTFDCAARITTI